MKKPDYPLPTVHMNGTSRKDLFDGYYKAYDALRDFIDAWGAIEFNARDYYVDGPTAFPDAQDKRRELSAKIKELQDYLHEHTVHLH